MKKMTTSFVALSVAATVALAAPKPLMNPFAETITPAPQPAAGSQTSAPQASAPQAAQSESSAPQSIQPLTSNYTPAPLPTAQTLRKSQPMVMTKTSKTRLVVKGQGVAPSFTQSPAQAFALAKRAAMVDAYRLLGEKIAGVKVEGQDLIKNMMVKRSQVRTEVNAMIKEATVIETEFKDGLCEIEVELIVYGEKWHGTLSHSFAE